MSTQQRTLANVLVERLRQIRENIMAGRPMTTAQGPMPQLFTGQLVSSLRESVTGLVTRVRQRLGRTAGAEVPTSELVPLTEINIPTASTVQPTSTTQERPVSTQAFIKVPLKREEEEFRFA